MTATTPDATPPKFTAPTAPTTPVAHATSAEPPAESTPGIGLVERGPGFPGGMQPGYGDGDGEGLRPGARSSQDVD